MASKVVLPLGPAALDITGVRAGDRNLFTLVLTSGSVPMDLTGMIAEAQARQTVNATTAITAVAEVSDPLAGQITLRWPGEEVRGMLGSKPTWAGVWDLQVGVPGEDPVTVVEGKFTAVMDVTRTSP